MILLNGQEIKPTIFPDKTSQVWKLSKELISANYAKIRWNFESEDEFMHLAQLKTLICKHGEAWKYELELPYLPYGRQDKGVYNDTTFALSVFSELINTLGFDKITIFDPHSTVAIDLIKNAVAVYPVKHIYTAIGATAADLLCYPDKGASEKYAALIDMPSISGEKIRDQSTGQITSYSVKGECAGKSVLIVDDICDGGSTFIHLSKELGKAGAKEINLYISHGIFSKGIEILRQAGIARIFTKEGEVK